MADVITSFKLETTQYDSKLRDASQALSQYSSVAAQAGNEFDKFTKDQAEAARALGSISTSANNAKDKVRELVAAYNQAANAYNALTKEQQQSDWGRALAESINTLKGRITEAKQELYSMGDSAKGTGGIMDVLKDKFTINIDALKLFNAGMTAAKVALDVAKDAFFASETNVDEWGRTVAATEGIYQSFLQTINNGNFSGFLSGIQNVIDKAKEAYNAMDELNTRMTIINPERAKLQTRATELKAIIRREGKDSEAGKAAQEALRALEPRLSKAFEKESKLNYNVFRSQVDAKLAEAGIKLNKYSPVYQMLMQSFSNDDLYNEFKKRGKGSITTEFKNYNNNGTSTTLLGSGYSQTVDTRNLEQKLLDLFTDEWRKTYSPYLTASFSAKGAAASAMLSDARYLKEGGAGGGGGGGGGKGVNAEVVAITGSIDEQTKNVQELQKAWRAAADDNSRQKIKAEIEEQQYILDRMTGKETFDPTKIQQITDLSGRTPWATPEQLIKEADVKLPLKLEIVDTTPLTQLENKLKRLQEEQNIIGRKSPELWQQYQQQINATKGKISSFKGEGKNKDNDQTTKQLEKLNDEFSKVVGGISSIASGLQQMGVEIPKELQSTLNVLQGISTIMSGILALVTLINGKQTAQTVMAGIPFFAHGGIVPHAANGYYVPGNSYSGDNTMIMANAGELVLSRSQQGVIAGALEGGAGRSVHVTGHLEGETIVLAADRYGRRTGKGELAFWK